MAEIVEAALERGDGERDHFLDEACGNDAELLAEVRSLLHFHEKAGDFLETPAIYLNAASLLETPAGCVIGARLGDYEILSLLGEGGMGEVYLAEDLALGRKVAIKVIKRSFGSANTVRHFRQEERILAGLNDPHIARLYGAAVTPEGLPYFVMEYVSGPRLDDYCDEAKLGLDERLALFRKVCSAVAYAHQHLVIHRDLKPANIRVTAEGEPKLLDFGIAKLLDPTARFSAEHTATLVGMMTPAYASPEQVRGENMTTVSDVYSLGVLLYELLAGKRPRELVSARLEDFQLAIHKYDPPPPSEAVARIGAEAVALSNARGLESPTRLIQRLAGDLDNIVLMAMRREPERRYASVGQFSEDIRRHLNGLPVVARKDTFRYRTAKFVRRHRTSVAAAALLVLTLVGGIVATTWQAHRAERRFEDVRRLAHSLMFVIHESIQNLAGSTPARRLIVSRALEYLESLAQDSSGNPSLQRELATAYEKIGEIQGNPFYANLGDTDGALTSYRKATQILEKLNSSRATPETQAELARCYRDLGDVLGVTGDRVEMLRQYRISLALFEKVSKENPADAVSRREVARTWDAVGDALIRGGGDEAESLSCYRKELAVLQEMLLGKPGDASLRRGAAVSMMKIGGALESAEAEAATSLRQAIDILQDLSAADPQNVRARREVAFACSNLGYVLQSNGDYAQALAYQRRSLSLRADIAMRDPQSAQAAYDLFQGEDDLCATLTMAGEINEAIEHGTKAAATMEKLLASDPTNVANRRNAGICFDNLATAAARAGAEEARPKLERIQRWQDAIEWYEKSREIFVTLRAQGTSRPADAEKPEKYAAKILECQDAKDRLSR